MKVKREREDRHSAIPGDGGRTDSIISIKSGRGEGRGGEERGSLTVQTEGGVAMSGVCLSRLIQ